MKRNRCDAEGCRYFRYAGPYCKGHQYLREDYKPAVIAPVSEAKSAADEIYYQLREKFLLENPECIIKAPGCMYSATDVNHIDGRLLYYLDVSTWEPSCRSCNDYCEREHAWAAQHGHRGSKFFKK